LAADCNSAATAGDWAGLQQRLQSALVLARVKRAHLEAQFNELSEKRSRRSTGNAVCDAYERSRQAVPDETSACATRSANWSNVSTS
jgi:hypothetical protein